MKRSKSVLFALCLGLLGFVGTLVGDERPNFLIIMADDCTYNDLPIYGGQNAKTPNLDALAKRGLTFNQAYLATAMCQPCRAELFTGQYPLRNGCSWNHSASRPTTKSLPHFLRRLGYRVGIAGKVHVKPAAAFPFDPVGGFDPNCVRQPTRTHDLGPVRDYISADKHETPFCLTIALVEPHVPWVMGDASQYPPKKIRLPKNIADTPETRKHYADYLAEITYMDEQVGEILTCLEDSGNAENTLVLFTSEQGSQFPGCKWTNWNTGVHTALIASWRGHVASGERTNALVQYADIAPTLIELAGGEPVADCDGQSFANVLLGQSKNHRDFVYGAHNNLPEGPRYPIRSVTDGRYHYIRNLLPDEIYIERHLMGGGRLNNPYWATWVGANPVQRPDVYELTRRYIRRPAEELYDTANDPFEMKNLIDSSELSTTRDTLRAELDSWMKSLGDPGAAVDTVDALQAARRGEHLHGPETGK
ncbi:sulfatase family protein [Thalassoroseus pseudoceratinae]|uniref:sulfatase family protein n=1 Tax=Thalassoroseus pseudoceratinae TaxID=2713176 RepID=UPI001424A77D|nr:sulfatase [Thalassoroseus pseudoceratinae]